MPTVGEKSENKAVGMSRGGRNAKIHALVDGLGNPVSFLLSPGNEPMLKETCLNLLLPVMETLEELHSKGVAHCDINEYNLIIDRSDKVWLVDFSMATEVNTCMNPDRVRTVLPGFAFSYPPELSYPYNLPVGPWTDVYRMGIMIARLTGADLELLRLQNVFRRPFEAAFCAVLEKAMQLEPSERFQNIKDMRRAFQNCLAHTEE